MTISPITIRAWYVPLFAQSTGKLLLDSCRASSIHMDAVYDTASYFSLNDEWIIATTMVGTWSSIKTRGQAMRSLKNLPGRSLLMKASVIIISERSVMNGNAPIVTKLVDGKETEITPTSVLKKKESRRREKFEPADPLAISPKKVIPHHQPTRHKKLLEGWLRTEIRGAADSSTTVENCEMLWIIPSLLAPPRGLANAISIHIKAKFRDFEVYQAIRIVQPFLALMAILQQVQLLSTTPEDLRVKVIRCDNRTEFKNRVMNQLCEMKGIKREFSVARTPQQNGVAERKNRTLIEAARTMLADLKLPTTFWAEAFNIACYVQNRVLVIKPYNKTPYELFLGRKHALSFMRPFGCPIIILNTIDHLGKFDGNVDEGFFVGYSTNNKAFKVFNSRTRIVEENLHVKFSEDTPNIAGKGPNWLFNIDALTISMNYKPIVVGNQSNSSADPPLSSSLKDSLDAGFKPSWEEEKNDAKDLGNEDSEVPNTEEPRVNQEKDASINSTNNINTVSPTVNAAGIENNAVDENIVYSCADDPNMPELEEIDIFSDAEDDNSGANMNNLDTYFQVSHVPTTRIHKDHPLEQVIGDLHSAPQTRRMIMNLEGYGLRTQKGSSSTKGSKLDRSYAGRVSTIQVTRIWTLVELPNGKRAIRTKWIFMNKKDERGIAIKNKARLVAQGYTQEEWIDYDEFFTPIARIEAIRLFLAYVSFKDFVVYQMDVNSDFLYGKIEMEVYVCQPPGFEDPDFPDRVYIGFTRKHPRRSNRHYEMDVKSAFLYGKIKEEVYVRQPPVFEDPDFPDRVYKVEKALYGLHQAPRAWYETLSLNS
ncbi:ribonuclease H-like domain-containing protein [Tanacetum coccineum]